jgi:hypothetical protein
MTAGPEKKTKDAIRALLKEIGAWYYMPVPMGYGKQAVDFIGVHRGRGFLIEAKRADGQSKGPTKRQSDTLEEAAMAGALVCVEDRLDCLNVRRMLGI